MTTLAAALKAHGYATALMGKWHLGLRPEVGPRRYGFDQSYGYFHGQLDQYTHRYKNGDRTWHRNDVFVDEEGHATDLIADEAVRFLQDGPPGSRSSSMSPSACRIIRSRKTRRWIKPYEPSRSRTRRGGCTPPASPTWTPPSAGSSRP